MAARRGKHKEGRTARPGRLDRDLQRAAHALEAGSLLDAERLSRAILERAPEHAGAWHCLAIVQARMGRPADALVSMRAAVGADPRDGALHNNLGNMLREAGRLDEAIDSYQAAVERAPEHANALFNLAAALQRAHRLDEACETLERLARIEPGDAEVWARLGRSLRALGRHEQARAALERACALDSRDLDAAAALAGVRASLGERAAARDALERLASEHAGQATARVELADLLWDAGEREAAVDAATAAVAAGPARVDTHRCLARIQLGLGRHEAAARSLRRCVELDPADPHGQMALARVLLTLGLLDGCESLARKAATLAPSDAAPHCLLASAALDRGDAAAARSHAAEALGHDPDSAEAWYLCVQTGALPDGPDAALDALRELAARPALAPHDASLARFAMASILDARDDVKGAFAAYRAANALRHEAHGSDGAAGLERLGARIRQVFTPEFLAARASWGIPAPLPVLVVGMPRSGTTLVERFLAAHPEVHAGGERTWLGELAGEAARAARAPYPEAMAAADEEGVRGLARRYLELLAGLAPGAGRVTDKLPGNFVHLGFAALLLPRVQVIHCRRDPLDVCVSNYFQAYAGGHEYSHDLTELARACREHDRLMAHWRATLPVRVHEVSYEALVTEPEPVVRAMVAACGLAWDDACLDHRSAREAVHTASHVQVRQPLYRSSIGRWRRYAAHLDELLAALAAPEPGEGL